MNGDLILRQYLDNNFPLVIMNSWFFFPLNTYGMVVYWVSVKKIGQEIDRLIVSDFLYMLIYNLETPQSDFV